MAASQQKWWSSPPYLLGYAVAFLSVALVIVWIRGIGSYWHALFFFAIFFSAWFGGLRPGLLAVVLSILAYDYYIVPPKDSFTISTDQLPNLIFFSALALLVGSLAAGQRSKTESLLKARNEMLEKVEELQRINDTMKGEVGERNRTERELLRGQDQLRLTIDTIPSLAWSARPDGHSDFVNRRWLEYTGLTQEQARGEAWTTVIHPDDLAPLWARWKVITTEGKAGEAEARMRRFDGEFRWFLFKAAPFRDENGNITMWFGTNTDIHDLKLAQDALHEAIGKVKESEEYLRNIIDTIPSLAWSTLPNGFADFINKRWLDYTGLSREEAQGRGWASAIHPADAETVITRAKEFRAAKKPGEVEARLRRYDGEYRWFLFKNAPLLNDRGEVVRWYGTNTDIDDFKRTEMALNRTQVELAHTTRMTAMGELAASIAHEVKQPLTGVINNANASLSLLPRGDSARDDIRAALIEIIDDANRANSVTTRVRELAKKSEVEKKKIDVKDVVTEVVALARYESGMRGVILQSEIPEGLPQVFGDRVQCQQVLLNLVLNGMDAMSETAPSERVLKITGNLQAREHDQEIVLRVRDAGIGIKPEVAERIFEAFYSTKENGMGMGLRISRTIIEAHGGRLWFETNQGRGATFLITLPVQSHLSSS